MLSRDLMGIGVLLVAVLSSALGVVYSTHQSRKLFIELQAVQAQRDKLDMEWGRLQLEQSTWSTHGRIEKIAHERLDMQLPEPDSAVIVWP
jgi:cell division protein FtsL